MSETPGNRAARSPGSQDNTQGLFTDDHDAEAMITRDLWRNHRLIAPASSSKKWWDAALHLLMMYGCFYTPMQAAFRIHHAPAHLALDSDVLVATDPYPHLRGAFGGYTLVTMFDTKGGFANTNVGVMYLQNATIGGPVHGLFVEFERRVRLALRLPPPTDAGQRAARETNLFWDQNLFNKVLLYRFLAKLLRVPVLVLHMVPPTHSTTSIAHTQTHASR